MDRIVATPAFQRLLEELHIPDMAGCLAGIEQDFPEAAAE